MVNRETGLRINGDRLNGSIEALATIGKLDNGGVARLAYSVEDIQGRNRVETWMREAGMSVRTDAAANLIGRYPGKRGDLGAIATGSHLDTVPSGGRYDGALGVLAGLEVVRTLNEQNLQLEHPIDVIVFTDEEGSMLGAKAMSGRAILDPKHYLIANGEDIQACLERLGGDWTQIQLGQRSDREVAAFIELHVEQGPVLEAAGVEIGIVEGIVGQRRFKITVEGRSGHAGTMPMSLRADALVAAAKVVLAVNEIGNAEGGQQVATVGWIQVAPNAVNAIPGRVELSLDLRDLSNQHLDKLLARLRQELEAIAASTGTKIDMELFLRNEPVLATQAIQKTIAGVCDRLGLSYLHLPSRASHDAQEMATFTQMGMIFVPSKSGVSHAQTEYTTPQECVRGANILLQTLLELDRKL